MLLSATGYNPIPLTTVFSQLFTFLLLSNYLLNTMVCIIRNFLCHDIKQAISYHIMEFYVTTYRMSRLSRHPYQVLNSNGLTVRHGFGPLLTVSLSSSTFSLSSHKPSIIILPLSLQVVSVQVYMSEYISTILLILEFSYKKYFLW